MLVMAYYCLQSHPHANVTRQRASDDNVTRLVAHAGDDDDALVMTRSCW